MPKNRLAQETSPYLKQHEDNPVDWYPWGDEALERARLEDKPILLSIGYSACHWCHVMAHESFENPETAELMNQNYVNIKLDREERPDLDHIYQNVAQMMTQGGGWPLTVFLTPDLKPFFGGTYFPPEDRYGRPAFSRLLMALSEAYQTQKDKVEENAKYLTQSIGKMESLPDNRGEEFPTLDALVEAGDRLLRQTDRLNGGFGSAPKFPNTMALMFLWRIGRIKNYPEFVQTVILSLEKMCRGGIYDQLGGGFSRYSVDERWAIPHFEKMLYDNALLLQSISEVLITHQTAGTGAGAGAGVLTPFQEKLFAETLESTIQFLSREMMSPDGLFYSALDADSEGEEGKFYAWNPAEVRARLDDREFAILSRCYGLTEDGNFEHRTTVFALDQTVEEAAAYLDISFVDARAAFASARVKLLDLRSHRVRPGLDNKVLTGWNGLMVSGLLNSSAALGTSKMAEKARVMARGAYTALLQRADAGQGRLFGTVQEGRGRFSAYLDDYAFMARAALDLARVEADSKVVHERIVQARGWIDVILKHFRDPDAMGYFFTADDHEALIHRPKTIFDQAIPSGTAVTLSCLHVLSEIDAEGTGAEYSKELEKQLTRLYPILKDEPFGFAEALNAALLAVRGAVVVSGPGTEAVAFRHPHLYRRANAGADQILVCHRQTCSLPLDSVDALISSLAGESKL